MLVAVSGLGFSSPASFSARPLAESAKERKVLCSYIAWGGERRVCGEGSVADVKKRCDKEATKVLGEPSECTCSDDPSYIQDVCD